MLELGSVIEEASILGVISRIQRKIDRDGISGLLAAGVRRLTKARDHEVDENLMIQSLFGNRGRMIDVGACHGAALFPFVRQGWEVFAFEPDPDNRHELRERIGKLTGIEVSDLAVTEQDGETLTFYSSPESFGISSLTPFTERHKPRAEVGTTRLDTFLALRGNPEIDYLKIDAEGHDLFVLRSYPFATNAPDVVLCEFENRKTRALGYEMTDMADLLEGFGYTVFISEWFPIERYGMSHRWRSFRVYPAALADDAGWGNLIAVRGEPMIDQARAIFG